MARFEVQWQVFGSAVIEAADEDAAHDGLYQYIDNELSIDYDGVDVVEVEPAAAWQHADHFYDED
jgi:hypothetical protein